MPQRIFLFANPISGRGRGARLTRMLGTILEQACFEPVIFEQSPGTIAAAALDPSAAAAIVVGGDGTLRSVAQRFHELGDGRLTSIPLLIVPTGTANLMARHLGIPWNADNVEAWGPRIVQSIRRRHVRLVDVAQANGSLFLLMAGVGLDGRIVHELARLRNGPITVLSYLLPAFTAMRNYDYPALRVTVDGQCVFAMAPAMTFVGNVAEYGTGFPMLPLARSDNGLLDVCVLPCSGHGDAVRHFLAAAAGEHLQGEGVVYARGRRVRIESSGAAAVQIDGDAAGHTPVDIEVIDEKLGFVVGE